MFVATATAASRPPSASEPVSPMKMRAGGALCHRKPAAAAVTAAVRTATSSAASAPMGYSELLRNCQNAISVKAPNTSADEPAASPSSPSVKFTALLEPTITR